MTTPINFDSQQVNQNFQSSESSSVDSILYNSAPGAANSSSDIDNEFTNEQVIKDEVKKNQLKSEQTEEDIINNSINSIQQHGNRLKNVNKFI